MKDYLKYIPGFRSDTTWKKIVAGFFYFAFIFSIVSGGLEGSLVFGGAILLGISIIDLVKNKKGNTSLKTPMLLLLAGVILLGSGTQVASQKATASKQTEEFQLMSKENEELKAVINTLKEDNEKLESANSELTEENDKFLAEEKKRKDEAEELAKKEEELRLAEEQKKEEEAKKQQEAKEKKEKEAAAAAEAQQSAKANASASNNNSNAKPSSGAVKQPAKQGVDNNAQILRTKSGKMYHTRKCGNGNFYGTTLNDAKAAGLTACSKCF